jgi:YggT family protein
MTALFTVVISIVRTLLYVINFAMLLRAVLSWLPLDEDNRLLSAVCMITEPIIYPVRVWLDRFEALRNFPLDISFLVTTMLIFVALMLIG